MANNIIEFIKRQKPKLPEETAAKELATYIYSLPLLNGQQSELMERIRGIGELIAKTAYDIGYGTGITHAHLYQE